MFKVPKLSEAMQAELTRYVSRGLDAGLGTDQYRKLEVNRSIRALYKAYSRPIPEIVHVASPRAGMQIAPPGTLRIAGSQELYWLLFYKFINDVVLPCRAMELVTEVISTYNTRDFGVSELLCDGDTIDTKSLIQRGNDLMKEPEGVKFKLGQILVGLAEARTQEPLNELLTVCEQVGWFWPGNHTCIVTPKPETLHMDKEGQLHSATGPSVRWKDGFALYHLHGIDVTAYAALTVEVMEAAQASTVKRSLVTRVHEVPEEKVRQELLNLLNAIT